MQSGGIMRDSVKLLSGNIDQLLKCSQSGENIADKVTSLIVKKEFVENQSAKIVYDVLVSNWHYAAISHNLKSVSIDPEKINAEMAKWKCADIVMAYHHPDLGIQIINPKNPAHKELMADFRKNELVVVYAGYLGKKDADTVCEAVLSKASDLLRGKSCKVPESLLKGSYGFKKAKSEQKADSKKGTTPKPASKVTSGSSPKTESAKTAAPFSFSSQTKTAQQTPAKSSITGKAPVKAAAPAPAPTPQRSAPAGNPSLRKMTPMISIPVTNELFHNGNVEAWKRIIASYQSKYPDLQIFVYYDGERITDINSLFKWGKVKHGSCIQFVVVGENIQDVAKLKRYFTQGASNMFEAFLQGAPGTILRLF